MAKIELESAWTAIGDPEEAAETLLNGIANKAPKLVLLFASRDRDHRALNAALRARLPATTRLIGASTAGEIDQTGFHQGGALLGALSGDFEVGLGLGRGLSTNALEAGAAALAGAAAELGTQPEELDPKHHVGLVIDDGFKYKKEEFLLGMLERNPDVLIVGGGATDTDINSATAAGLIHVDGEVLKDAVLLAMFRTDAPFAALRSHWYTPTGHSLTITKVDETHTRALEIDGKPAAARYAELIGCQVDELVFGTPRGFALHPTALKIGREYYMRSPWKPLDDGSVLFANMLEEGMQLELMQLGDMVGITRAFFTEEIPRKVKNPSAAIFFNCGARAFFSATMGKAEELATAFAVAPACVGFNVHFEIYAGFQVNTTLTALVFGTDE